MVEFSRKIDRVLYRRWNLLLQQCIEKMSPLSQVEPASTDFYFSTDKYSIAFGPNPFHNEDGSIQLVLDGEIYNSRELRTGLIKRGHSFHTDTPGEEIIHLYEDAGVSGFKELNGSFAFVLWDSKKEILLLARDNFGIKPLYYWLGDSKSSRQGGASTVRDWEVAPTVEPAPTRLLFASEMKVLLADNSVERMPNDAIIYDFLVTGVHEHTEDTFFKGIKKVMPAECVIVNVGAGAGLIAGGTCSYRQKYWTLNYNPSIATRKPEVIINEFYELFEDSVRIRTGSPNSSGEFGALLSGGLDSSSVVGMLCIAGGTCSYTFSSYHTDAYLDERKYISAVVRKWGLENKYIIPESKELWNEFKDFIWHQEEPVRGASSWDHFALMRFVRENGIKFLFDGQGGDETLYGYVGYFPQFLIELWRRGSIEKALRESIAGINLLQIAIRDRLIGHMGIRHIVPLLNPDFMHKFRGREDQILKELFPGSLREKSFYAITKYSLAFLLKETERNAGAFGIELRIPFLDPRLVEYAFSLPVEYKIRNGWNKWILRKIGEARLGKDILPVCVKNRKRKIGFGTPEARWARELSKEIKGFFESEACLGANCWVYIDRKKFLQSFDDFCNGRAIQPDFFWRVVSLEFWLKYFF